MLRVDQDSLGLQAVKVAEPMPGLEVWSKPLSTAGERAVLLLNRTASPAPIAVRWSELGLRDDSPATVTDIWTKSSLGEFRSSYSATVPAEDAMMLIVLGGEGPTTAYFPEESKMGEANVAGRTKNQELNFTRVSSKFPIARIRITYLNPDKAPRFAELRVNGRIATRIAFPPTGSGNVAGVISIESSLENGGVKNVLSFSSAGDLGPAIQSISLQ